MPKQVQAVLFDLFETLISEYAFGTRKVSREKRDYQQLLGIANEVFRREWGARVDQRMSGYYRDFPSVLKDILVSQQLKVDESQITLLYEERISEKATAFEIVDSEVIQMLRCLKESGLKLALVSNATEEEVRAWFDCELADWFDEVLFSYEVGLVKPDYRIYELACSRLGVVPSDCIFVGDGGFNELIGAMEAGMTAYQAEWFVDEPYRKPVVGCKPLASPGQLLDELGWNGKQDA